MIILKFYFMIHLAPPCATWSRARLPRLRRVGPHILGVPGLSAREREKVSEGTALMRAAVLLAKTAVQEGIGFSLENPASSMVWLWEEMGSLLKMPGVIVVDLVYCAYGMPWMKPTRIVTNVKELAALARRCSGDHQHQMLRGVAPCGVLWTRIACPYPALLCSAYGRQVREALYHGSLAHLRQTWEPQAQYAPHCRPIAAEWHPVERWVLAWRGEWAYQEHINIQELRVLVGVSRHLARSRRNWDQRHLVLTDSQVVLACAWKGRSRSYPLLRQLRRICSITLACGIRLCVRWVPTQFNNADRPSRGGAVGVEAKEVHHSKPHVEEHPQLRYFRPNL